MCHARHPFKVLRYARAYRRGFTLLEMLIVMVIIAIMASLMIPSLGRSMAQAKSTVCKHHLHQIDVALRTYLTDSDGWLPVAANTDPDKPAPAWFNLLFPDYLKDPMIMTCREDPYWLRMVNARFEFDDPETSEYSSYGLNSFMAMSENSYLLNLDRNGPRRPHDTLLIADAGPDFHSEYHGGGIPEGTPSRNGGLISVNDSADPLDGLSGYPWITLRHGTGINALTVGGAVREIPTKELMQEPIQSFYNDCSMGGCTLCSWSSNPIDHYSFSSSRVYWWTGPVPPTVRPPSR